MKLTVKKLMKREEILLKEHLQKNMAYLGYYAMMIVVCVMSLGIGADRGGELWGMIGLCYVLFSLSVDMYIGTVAYVMENGKNQNIFLKYAYIPVSLKELLIAKLAVVGKRIGKSTVVAQIFAFIGLGVEFEIKMAEGVLIHLSIREVLFLFTPVWCGVLIFLLHFRSVYKELHADHETGTADNK